MVNYDAVIAGGGPTGSYVAKELANKGFTAAVFEEHKQIGLPLKCAGMVSSRVFDLFNIPKKDIIQNEIYGAHIHSPLGSTLTIGGNRTHALAIDRPQFDNTIINQGITAGAELYLHTKIRTAQRTSSGIAVTTQQQNNIKPINCNLLIGADGAHSKVRDRFHLPAPVEMLQGIGAEATNISIDPRFVELYLGNDIAPGFFAWVIPINKHGIKARIGLCISASASFSAKHYFTRFLKNKLVSSSLHEAKISKHSGGVIPLGLLKKTTAPNVMLVGDAAAQVKPTSGGGVYTGLVCAQHCSNVATEALQAHNYSFQLLKQYQKAWTDEIGRELILGMNFRTIFQHLSDVQIDRYLNKLNNEKIITTINEYGDIDFPSKLILPLIKKAPSLLQLLLHYKI